MSCNNCNNCEQCKQTLSVQSAPPPTCNTRACEEYTSSDCVTNEVNGACQGTFTPLDGSPQINVGYSFSQNDTLSTVLAALSNPNNCTFSVPYLGAMLQYIHNDTTLSQIFCAIVSDCVDGCPLNEVTTVTFNPIQFDSVAAYWISNFYPHLGTDGLPDYTYLVTISDTTATVPTVYQATLNPADQISLIDSGTGLINYDFNNLLQPPLIQIAGPQSSIRFTTLPAGHTYEIVITAQYAGSECASDTFTLVIPSSPACADCSYNMTFDYEHTEQDPGCIYLDIISTDPLSGLPSTPYAYSINVIDLATGTNVTSSPIVIVTADLPSPGCGYTFCLCGLTGTDYTVEVTAVCSFNPLYCFDSTIASITISTTPPAACAVPDITSIIITP